MHQWWKCLVFGFSFCLKAWELLIAFFFLFHLWQQNVKMTTVNALNEERKTSFVVYISTNTGEQRKISAQRRTSEKYKSDSGKCTKVTPNQIKRSTFHPGSSQFRLAQHQPNQNIWIFLKEEPALSGGAFGWISLKKFAIRRKSNWDKLPVHNLGYQHYQDNIKWSVLKLDNTKAKCTQSFFNLPYWLNSFSNVTIYGTPKISIINTEGCFSLIAHRCVCNALLTGMWPLHQLNGFLLLTSAIVYPFWMPRNNALSK